VRRGSKRFWRITLCSKKTTPGDRRKPIDDEVDPLVSCILIFFNEEKYLGEAIESVVAQSHPNWELLLIDDGSTDASQSIARSYCERFPGQVHYLTHEGRANRGRSATRNLGLRHARGEFAAFLDGDDWWYPDKLERQIALFRQHTRAVTVCGATQYWYSWQLDDDRTDRVRLVGQFDKVDGTQDFTLVQDRMYESGHLTRHLYPLGRGLTPSLSGIMFRLEAALAVDGFDDSFRGLFDDQVFRTKMFLHGPVFVSHEVFDRYRQHDASCCHVAWATGRSEEPRRQFIHWLRHYLDNVGYRDPVVRLQLRRNMLRSDYPSVHRAWSRLQAVVRKIIGRG
jgi:glycosyltransferase involved in cell wall biosynthesis